MFVRQFAIGLAAALCLSISSCGANPEAVEVIAEEITFQTGELEFTGTLFAPDMDQPVPLLILFHAASGGSENFPFYEHLKTDLPAQGVATFIYNRRGTNGQPGDFETASFETLAGDGIAAAQKLVNDPRIDNSKIGAWAISQGGWVAPLAANLDDTLHFAISVSGPGVTPSRQMAFTAAYHLREAGYSEDVITQAMTLRDRVDAFYRNPEGRETLQTYINQYRDEEWFSLVFLPRNGNLPEDVTQSKWFYEMDFDPTQNLSTFSKPFLAVFGAKDRWVPVDESVQAIRNSVPVPKHLTVFVSDASGHLMSGETEGSNYNGERPVEDAYIDTMARWISDLE